MANTRLIFPIAGASYIKFPEGTTYVEVLMWGGGGAGKGMSAQGAGSGGAGGQFVWCGLSIVAGVSYRYVVAASTADAAGNGRTGAISYFNGTSWRAQGGMGAGLTNPALGTTLGSIGMSIWAGGNGGTNMGYSVSGGGGGGAGSYSAGGNATAGATPGVGGVSWGGLGGVGRKTAGAGTAGVTAGGGGGGGWRITSTNRLGGDGAAGRIEFLFDQVPPLAGNYCYLLVSNS
jgi:hypothetical protein